MASIITFRGVTKRYGRQGPPAVSALNLEVPRGEVLTVLGPSGCGKTTTLRLAAGFEHPDEGEIILDGRVVAGRGVRVPPEERGVGMVFQDYALFPHLTVEQNVAFGLHRFDLRTRTRRQREVLELVGLSDLARRFPHELSGGQQQRVALARALAPMPLVVLLDEPFSNLDADLRDHVREDVSRIIREAGITAIFVTHDQKDALAISDRIAVMKGGRVEQVGAPRVVYQRPATEFVATFLGRANLLAGVVERGGRTVRTDVGRIVLAGGQTSGLREGMEVVLAVRPDSFEVDPAGPWEGRLVSTTYAGSSVEAVVEVCDSGGGARRLYIHLHPEDHQETGSLVRFKVLPDFVSILDMKATPILSEGRRIQACPASR